MVSGFNTVATGVTFVDDSTLLETWKKSNADRIQEAANQAIRWSKENNLGKQ